MKRIVLALSACLLLLLSACRTSSSSEAPRTPEPTPGASVLSSEDEPVKVVLTLSRGHLHGRQSFHFVPSGGTFELRDYQNTQTFTFVKQGESWVLAPESLQSFIGFQRVEYTPGDLQASSPQYGAVLRFYNRSDSVINEHFAGEATRQYYQIFAYPSDVQGYDGTPVSYDPAQPQSLVDYVYCDTNVWDQSAGQSPRDASGSRLYYFLPESEPVGIKGYYMFNTTSQFTLNLDLWYSPSGKLENGQPSPFYQPNGTMRQGQRLVHLELPMHIFADMDFQDEVIAELDDDYNERKEAATTDEARDQVLYRPLPLERLPEERRPVALRLMRLLGTSSWDAVQRDLIQYWTNPGVESSSEGYF